MLSKSGQVLLFVLAYYHQVFLCFIITVPVRWAGDRVDSAETHLHCRPATRTAVIIRTLLIIMCSLQVWTVINSTYNSAINFFDTDYKTWVNTYTHTQHQHNSFSALYWFLIQTPLPNIFHIRKLPSRVRRIEDSVFIGLKSPLKHRLLSYSEE